jgi:hypothetical protein
MTEPITVTPHGRLATAVMLADDIAMRLNRLKPDDRKAILELLERESCFCWECGNDFHSPERICHCTNDE